MRRRNIAILIIGIFLTILFIQLIINMVGFRPPEELKLLSVPRAGFYRGFSIPEKTALFFVFYDHPQYGSTPLLNNEHLFSNRLRLVGYSFKMQDLELELYSYRLINKTVTRRVGNESIVETIAERVDEDLVKIPIHLIADSFTRKIIELPNDPTYKYYEIRYGNRTLFKFKHKTLAAFLLAEPRTLGEITLDRMYYMVGATFIVILAFATSRYLIDRVGYVPPIPTWFIAILPIAFIAILGYVVLIVVYYMGLVQAAYLYPILYIISIFIGLMMLKPKPTGILLEKISMDKGDVRKNIEILDVIMRGNKIYLYSNSWKDFFLGRKTEIVINAKHEIQTDNSDIPLCYYYKDIKYLDGKIFVDASGIHELDKDLFLSQMKTLKNIVVEKDRLFEENIRLMEMLEAKADEKARKYLDAVATRIEKFLGD